MSSISTTQVPFQISNYDILLRKHKDNHIEMISFNDHIGNRRFQILLEMNRISYNRAMVENGYEGCERVLENMVHALCHECIPKGRFLEQDLTTFSTDGVAQWYDLGDGPVAIERARRGFLGLLFTFPKEISSVNLDTFEPSKKTYNVNLADERFLVKNTIVRPRDTAKSIAKHNISFQGKKSTSIPSTISTFHIDDVLFYGEKEDATFKHNYCTGNRRLHQLITSQTKHYSYVYFSKYAEEIVQDLVQKLTESYPNIRFLKEQKSSSASMWVVMDLDSVKSKIISAIQYSYNLISNKRVAYEDNNSIGIVRKTLKLSPPQFTSFISNDDNTRRIKRNTKRSRAA